MQVLFRQVGIRLMASTLTGKHAVTQSKAFIPKPHQTSYGILKIAICAFLGLSVGVYGGRTLSELLQDWNLFDPENYD